MARLDRGARTASQTAMGINAHAWNGVPSVSVRIRETMDVKGNIHASHCRYIGRFSSGKNTPQKRNMGKMSKYCGYEISSIVRDFAATSSPSPANNSAPRKHNGMASKAPRGLKSPIARPISNTAVEEKVAFEASHNNSAHRTSDSVIGVTAMAWK